MVKNEADEASFKRASCAITRNLNSLLSHLSEDSLEDLKWSGVFEKPFWQPRYVEETRMQNKWNKQQIRRLLLLPW